VSSHSGRRRRWLVWGVALALSLTGHGSMGAQAPLGTNPNVAFVQLGEADVREWLTELSSDAMQGRGAFTEGYGLAAGYVSEQLRRIGAEPAGIDGTYLRPVNRTAYRVTRNSSVRVEVGGQTRTFKHGEHVSFPALAGSSQTLTFAGVDFVGYGVPGDAPTVASRNGRLVVLLPGMPSGGGRLMAAPAMSSVAGRAEALVGDGAGAAMFFGMVPTTPAAAPTGGRPATPAINLTTVLRVDRPRPPVVTGDQTFFEFLLSGAPVPFADLRERATRGQPLDGFSLPDVQVTINIDHTYEVVTVERTHNVVATVAGTDPALRDTYVLGARSCQHSRRSGSHLERG